MKQEDDIKKAIEVMRRVVSFFTQLIQCGV